MRLVLQPIHSIPDSVAHRWRVVYKYYSYIIRGITIDRKKLYDDTRKILKMFSFNDLEPDARISDLSIGNQQMIEIIRAISLNARLIIFDEPTSSLSEREADMLFSIIGKRRPFRIGRNENAVPCGRSARNCIF